MSRNVNPSGKNQYNPVLKFDDEKLVAALRSYHREQLTSNTKISARLLSDHGIQMSDSTVKRRRKRLGLTGSGVTTTALGQDIAEQLVLEQMDQDPAKRHGVRTIQAKIAFNKEIHLKRDFVSAVMHEHDSDGFAGRDPTCKKIRRDPKFPIGIHERWAGDGHDKLYKIGYPLWAVVDDATGKWLGAWIVPSNRMGEIVAYLFLCLVEKFGGMPLQFTTDCGSETTKLFGLANALRNIFHPEYDLEELPAHVYLRSVHNISIERQWLRLRLDWGDNVVMFFNKGVEDGVYNAQIPQQYELCQWLWPMLLRTELQKFVDFRNGARVRLDKTKPGPSGMSRNEAFSLPENWGGRDCLLPVDTEVIRAIKEHMGGDALLEFTSAEFSARAQEVYDSLKIVNLSLENVWGVFTAMYPLLYGAEAL
ncbi:hypothetical protein BD410DRAFT_817268 [Rickenella mellea]|uniref:Integrase catalytic domain-containing protein n=1 Tax=Rickenella mellea TaxID=50990 RepID=A0A4Y7PGT6_9AGAM|nr:hypothetical protein BD410DRAFT_817268 [Rickenella mellea]